jgi:hypothetical protein
MENSRQCNKAVIGVAISSSMLESSRVKQSYRARVIDNGMIL